MGNRLFRSRTESDQLSDAIPYSSPQRNKKRKNLPADFSDWSEKDVGKWIMSLGFLTKKDKESLSKSAKLLGITGQTLNSRDSKLMGSFLNLIHSEANREEMKRHMKDLSARKPLCSIPRIHAKLPEKELTFILSKLQVRYEKASVSKREKDLLKEARVLGDLDRMKATLLKLTEKDTSDIDKNGWRIKLVITELSHRPLPKSKQDFRSKASSLLNAISLAPRFGMFHTCLIIGPFYLHWNDSDMCIPRSDNFMSAAAYFACDIDTVNVGVDDGVDRLSRLVCHWNRTKTYNNFRCNCHHFVEEVALAFGLSLHEHIKNTAIGDYVTKLKTSGSCDLRFRLDKDLLPKIKDWLIEKDWLVGHEHILFETHSQLDQFCKKVEEVDKDYFLSDAGRKNRSLLKSFDRGFWLRYYHCEARSSGDSPQAQTLKDEIEKYEPCKPCPFGDPRGQSFR